MSLWSLARWAASAVLVLVLVAVLVLGWAANWELQAAVRIWMDYARLVDRLYDFVDRTARFIVPFATIGGAIYGIYHKWQFSRSRMKVHIREFLMRDDKRLMPTARRLGELVDRPSAAREFGSPIFSATELESILKRMRWGKVNKADVLLTEELSKLNDQIEQWGNLQDHYNRHKAQAHLLKGAIAASRAAEANGDSEERRKNDTDAFEQFKRAYALNSSDVEALEYMAHQRVRLGDNASALADFESLQKLAEKQGMIQLQSRALKFQATIREHEGVTRLLQNPTVRPAAEPNLRNARDLLNRALDLLPDSERGGLEEAELYELRGRVHKMRQTFRYATDDYTAAERIYDRIAKHSDDHRDNDDNDPNNASAGLVRVKKALEEIRLRPLPPTDAPVGNGADDQTEQVGAEAVQTPNNDLTTKPTA